MVDHVDKLAVVLKQPVALRDALAKPRRDVGKRSEIRTLGGAFHFRAGNAKGDTPRSDTLCCDVNVNACQQHRSDLSTQTVVELRGIAVMFGHA
jgi:hypothetical protein